MHSRLTQTQRCHRSRSIRWNFLTFARDFTHSKSTRNCLNKHEFSLTTCAIVKWKPFQLNSEHNDFNTSFGHIPHSLEFKCLNAHTVHTHTRKNSYQMKRDVEIRRDFIFGRIKQMLGTNPIPLEMNKMFALLYVVLNRCLFCLLRMWPAAAKLILILRHWLM